MNFPLPAMKPDGAGGYAFCPKCAVIWTLFLLASAGVIWYLWKGSADGRK